MAMERIPIIATAADLPAAVDYATETESARWYVMRRAMQLGQDEIIPTEWLSTMVAAFRGDRQKEAQKGNALPDGSFPIPDKDHLRRAIHAYGRAKDKARAKSHIIKRAKALDAEDMLPGDWKPSSAMAASGTPVEDAETLTTDDSLHASAFALDGYSSGEHDLDAATDGLIDAAIVAAVVGNVDAYEIAAKRQLEDMRESGNCDDAELEQLMETITASVRHVRTPEGQAFYGQPIGSVIVKDTYLPAGKINIGLLKEGDFFKFGNKNVMVEKITHNPGSGTSHVSLRDVDDFDEKPTVWDLISSKPVETLRRIRADAKASLGKRPSIRERIFGKKDDAAADPTHALIRGTDAQLGRHPAPSITPSAPKSRPMSAAEVRRKQEIDAERDASNRASAADNPGAYRTSELEDEAKKASEKADRTNSPADHAIAARVNGHVVKRHEAEVDSELYDRQKVSEFREKRRHHEARSGAVTPTAQAQRDELAARPKIRLEGNDSINLTTGKVTRSAHVHTSRADELQPGDRLYASDLSVERTEPKGAGSTRVHHGNGVFTDFYNDANVPIHERKRDTEAAAGTHGGDHKGESDNQHETPAGSHGPDGGSRSLQRGETVNLNEEVRRQQAEQNAAAAPSKKPLSEMTREELREELKKMEPGTPARRAVVEEQMRRATAEAPKPPASPQAFKETADKFQERKAAEAEGAGKLPDFTTGKSTKLGTVNKDASRGHPEHHVPKETLADGHVPASGDNVMTYDGKVGQINRTYQLYSEVHFDDGSKKVIRNTKLNAVGEIREPSTSPKRRAEAAAQGNAMTDGSFPINNLAELKKAVRASGRAKDKQAARDHIIRRANELGHPEVVPTSWQTPQVMSNRELEATKDDALNELQTSARELAASGATESQIRAALRREHPDWKSNQVATVASKMKSIEDLKSARAESQRAGTDVSLSPREMRSLESMVRTGVPKTGRAAFLRQATDSQLQEMYDRNHHKYLYATSDLGGYVSFERLLKAEAAKRGITLHYTGPGYQGQN